MPTIFRKRFAEILSLLTLIVVPLVFGDGPEPGKGQRLILNEADPNYELNWQIDGDEITFECIVKTLGWIGLGFSPDGVMAGSDIVVGGVKNGQPYLYDRHGTGNEMPPMDAHQDYEILEGSENATHTILKFKRKLITNDKEDCPLSNGTVNIIWSLNPNDVRNESDFDMHTARGSKMNVDLSQQPKIEKIENVNIAAENNSISAVGEILATTLSEVGAQQPVGTNIQLNTSNVGSVPDDENIKKDNKNVYLGSTGHIYSNYAQMDKNGTYHVYWRYDKTNITFEIQVKAQGWIALGFSPNGGMAGSDITLIYIDSNGQPQISDRYATHNGFPPEDAIQNSQLLFNNKNDTHIVASFTRIRDTCDEHDMLLKDDDTVRVIYAYSNVIPQDRNNFVKHEFNARATKSLLLFQPPVIDKPLPSDTKTLDFMADKVHVPEDFHTLYWCQVFDLPKWKKHHIIRFDPIIQAGNEPVVHHMILYHCEGDLSDYVGKGEPCFDRSGRNSSKFMEKCKGYAAGWAVGGGNIIYPDNVGRPIFGDEDSGQIMIEMHYDNSNYLKNKIDSSGFRIYVTPTLRPVEAASITFGVPVGSEYTMIPARQNNFTVYAYCSANCTSAFDEEGYTVYSGLLHTHLAGVSIGLHQIRNKERLEPVFFDDHYDFNYQAERIKLKQTKVMPNDEFIVECVYNTSSRNETTFGGFSTRQEMCLVFLTVFPAPSFGDLGCFSFPDYKKGWTMFGAKFGESQDVIMPDGSNMTAKDYAEKQINFSNQSIIDQYQNFVRNGKHIIYCPSNEKEKQSAEGFKNKRNYTAVLQEGYPEFDKSWSPETSCTQKVNRLAEGIVNVNGTTLEATTPSKASTFGMNFVTIVIATVMSGLCFKYSTGS